MKVSLEARRLAKYKEKKKEFSVATLQFDVTFCTPIPCAQSVRIGFCTTLCVFSIDRQVEREMRVLFEFRHLLTQRARLRISKIRVYLCKKF